MSPLCLDMQFLALEIYRETMDILGLLLAYCSIFFKRFVLFYMEFGYSKNDSVRVSNNGGI